MVDYKVYHDIVNSSLRGIKKDYGMFFTPERIVGFMVNLIDIDRLTGQMGIAILEPARGLAQLGRVYCREIKNHSRIFVC